MIRGFLLSALLAAIPCAGAFGQVAERARSIDWRVLRDDALAFHYAPGQRRVATRLLESVRSAPPLPALPPDVLANGDPVRIFLAPDAAAFDSLTGGRAPEWGAGIAYPGEGRVVLPVYASDRVPAHELPRVLRHELAHVALHRYLSPYRVPRWFDEGYSRFAAGEWGWQAAWRLRLAFLVHDGPPLDSISLAWPRREAEAQAAYLLATSAVGFLIERGGGVRGLELFLRRWRAAGSMDAALRRTYGLTPGQFEEDWRRDVRDSYGWTFLLADTAIFWGFAAVLLLLLFALRRRRDRRRLERLRATEPPDRPAFWLGEYEIDDATDDAGDRSDTGDAGDPGDGPHENEDGRREPDDRGDHGRGGGRAASPTG